MRKKKKSEKKKKKKKKKRIKVSVFCDQSIDAKIIESFFVASVGSIA